MYDRSLRLNFFLLKLRLLDLLALKVNTLNGVVGVTEVEVGYDEAEEDGDDADAGRGNEEDLHGVVVCGDNTNADG